TAELEVEETSVRERLEAATAHEAAAERLLQEADQRRAALQPRLEELERLRRAVAELAGDLKLAEHKVSEARERHGQLDRQLVEALSARDKVEPLLRQLAPLAALKTEAAALDEQEKAVVARQGYEAQLSDLRKREQAVAGRLRQLPRPADLQQLAADLETRQAERTAVLEEAEQARTAWVRDLQDAQTKRQTLLDQYKDVREQRQRLIKAGPEGVCPTCTRPLAEEYRHVLDVLTRQLEEITFNGNFYKQRLEQLKDPPPAASEAEKRAPEVDARIRQTADRLAQLRTLAQEEPALRAEETELAGRIAGLEQTLAASAVPYDRARHEEVRRIIASLEPVALQVERLRVVADRAEDLVKEAEVAERTLSEREGQVRDLQARMSALGYREWDHDTLQQEVKAADSGRQEAAVALERARGERRAAADTLALVGRRREERARREQEARSVSVDLGLHNELDRALGDLRTDLNATLRPDLSDTASVFLRDMTGGRYGELELNEDYIPTVMDEGEAKQVISGGEEDIANLALRLAISQMIAERAGQPLSLLVLDEIFGSLDEERRAAVLDLLRGLADRFPQVILITHIESVREGFDRVIRVEFDRSSGSAVLLEEPGGVADGLAA
ncbi:MAG: SbcC/MukB-like Walker B domain-containing protein, partial [Gemmatimonadales bacterium]